MDQKYCTYGTHKFRESSVGGLDTSDYFDSPSITLLIMIQSAFDEQTMNNKNRRNRLDTQSTFFLHEPVKFSHQLYNEIPENYKHAILRFYMNTTKYAETT
jgi:hypothetical protein